MAHGESPEQLRRDGWQINRKAVQRHMREMGLEAMYPGPNLSKRRQQDQIYPYLLRGVTVSQPNQVWGIDITYVRLQQGWMYLVAILDWYARYVGSLGTGSNAGDALCPDSG
jgi:putative transposase